MTFEGDGVEFHHRNDEFQGKDGLKHGKEGLQYLVDSLLLSIASDKKSRSLGVERLESFQNDQSGGN